MNTCELTFSTKKYRGYTSRASTSSATYDVVDNKVTIPGHSHAVNLNVVEFNTLPTSVTIKVDGNTIPGSALNRDRVDLVEYLSKTDGTVDRGRHEISITPIGNPSGVARIEAYVILRVFIQSRIGGVY